MKYSGSFLSYLLRYSGGSFDQIAGTRLIHISAFFLLVSCSTTSSDFEPVTISGIVTDSNENPLNNAIVRITQPLPESYTTTDEIGSYAFFMEVDSSITIRIEAQKEGYRTESMDFLAIPERNVDVPDFRLTSLGEGSEDDDIDDGEDEVPPPDPDESGEAANLTFKSISNENIQIREAGGIESTVFEFIVTDSAGIPVGNHQAVDVSFEIVSGPDGGETIFPAVVQTDNGIARGSLTSGTIAGTVQIKASFTNSIESEIRSQPVKIVMHAGHPSPNHFSIFTAEPNVALTYGAKVPVSVLVGDKYGNEVQDGTAVYFTTDGGFIYGSGYTSNGQATVDLTVGNPIPSDGIATITANTVGDQQQQISASTQIIFSEFPLINVTPESFDIPNAEDQQFTYSVKDFNGHPMVPGTTITVTVEGDEINVLGDVAITVGSINDDATNLNQLTDFSFIIDDANPDTVNDTPAQITIQVTGPNGNAKKTITGRKSKSRF